jgi:hypothetical protein
MNEKATSVHERSPTEKGYVGETFVMAKLSSDLNIISVKVPQEFFSYDLITSNNKRLEIKTAILRKSERKHPKKTYYSDGWEFGRNPKQLREDSSDFVVCICFSSNDFSHKPRCFIIPSKEVQGRSVFKISANPQKRRKPKFWEYEDEWNLILK